MSEPGAPIVRAPPGSEIPHLGARALLNRLGKEGWSVLVVAIPGNRVWVAFLTAPERDQPVSKEPG